MKELDLEPLQLEEIDKKEEPSNLDLQPLELEPMTSNEEPIEETISPLKSGLLGGAQGATLGYADELEGALKALGEKGQKIIQQEDHKDLKALYKQHRDQSRKRYKEAEEANPGSYFGGNVAGGIASGLATGGTSLPAMAALGAAQGLGASEADLTGGSPYDLMDAAKDTAIGGGLGLVAGKAGQSLGKFLTPEATEQAAGKLAASAAGLTKGEALAKKGIDIASVGKTALEEGASPMTGGPSNMLEKAREAIDINEERLNPLFKKAQAGIQKNLPETLENAGHIGDKVGKALEEYRVLIAKDPDAKSIMDKLEQKYIPYIEDLVSVDGNLFELNSFKQALQKKGRELGSYSKQFPEAKPEAQFVKRLGGIVREHIEDVANQVPEQQLGTEIKQLNSKLKNLYTYEDAAEKLVDKSTGKSFIDRNDLGAGIAATALGSPFIGGAIVAKKGIEIATGNPLQQTVKQALSKGALATSKALKTQLGDIVLKKGGTSTARSVIANPFSIDKLNRTTDHLLPAYAMYNADDDSLKDIANKLKQHKDTTAYAEMLEKAIINNDKGEKDKAIYMILSTPNGRKLFIEDENE